MATVLKERLLTTREPDQWPPPPSVMTFTRLAEIEACPRRWALDSAEYPEVWNKSGYPPRPNIRAIEGSVIHAAVERIIQELVKGGCPSLQQPAAVNALRSLGGLTAIVTECIEQMLERFSDNPRLRGLKEFMARSLRAKLPHLRPRVQTLLASMRLPTLHGIGGRGRYQSRRALSQGAFAEIELRGEQIGWKGKFDLLIITADACEITDFKTGTPDPNHQFQMEVYALLWSLDRELNPDARSVTKLTLAYSDKDIDVPTLSPDKLEEFQTQVRQRGDAARLACVTNPPKALPGIDNCPYCTVRHLCTEYWTPIVQNEIGASANSSFVDIELELTKQHGATSWDAIVVCSGFAETGRTILVRSASAEVTFRAGQRLRLLGVNLATDNAPGIEQEPFILHMGTLTEAFVVV